jgi:hypothetical protein
LLELDDIVRNETKHFWLNLTLLLEHKHSRRPKELLQIDCPRQVEDSEAVVVYQALSFVNSIQGCKFATARMRIDG